jgi:CHAT domain-containing protein/tetratricopeptide (TPR) repeat protein
MLKLQIVLEQLAQEADPHQRTALCDRALTLVPREQNPIGWAALQKHLADSLVQDPSGSRRNNLERAIEAYGRAIEVYVPGKHPEQWAAVQNDLGIAYAERVASDRSENLERAIGHYEQSLTVRNRIALPEGWAGTQNNLGNAYVDRVHGSRAENMEEAIRHYEQALEIYTFETFPERWAGLQNNLGTALQNRILGNRVDNIEKAKSHLEAALTVRTREALSGEWATTQNNLAAVYLDRSSGDHAENLECAIEHANAALTVWSREAQPRRWAGAQNNLAGAYFHRVRGDRAENLERAIHHYEQALTVRTREALPEAWARIQHNLSIACRSRVRGDHAKNLERAIEHAQAALMVRTQDALPGAWAETQNAIGAAYRERIDGDRRSNRERAIEHAEAALKVFTRVTFPEAWAGTQNSLGLAFESRVRGDRADNLERAIYHYQEALQVYSAGSFPEAWSNTQHNLANAYSERVREERASEDGDNLELAIHHYEQALTVQTREHFPREWAMTQNHLGSTYAIRFYGRREENLERAIHHLEAALTVHTLEELPEEWAESQNKLGGIFTRRVTGNRRENIERAIVHYRKALRVRTRKTLPTMWAEVQNNLGLAYRDRIEGDRAGNLERAVRHLEAALQIYTRQSFPAEHRIVQRNLGDLQFARRNWAPAHASFQAAIEAGDDLFAAAYTEVGRHAEVGETSRLHAAAAYCLLRLGRATEALLTLEYGKTRLLNEALALDRLELAALPQRERESLMAARQVVRGLEAEVRLRGKSGRRREQQLVESLRQARADLARCVQDLCINRPSLLGGRLQLGELLELIPEKGALVAPVITSQGSAAFVLPYGTSVITNEHIVMLDQFAERDLLSLLLGSVGDSGLGRDDILDLGGWLGGYANRSNDWPGWLAAIEDAGRKLWDGVIGPVHGRLRDLGLSEDATVLLLPQGGLGLLPLHAAWQALDGGRHRYFLDDYTIVYAPSCYAIWVSNRRVNDPQRGHRSLLAVVDPTGTLPHAPAECDAVLELFASLAGESLGSIEMTEDAVVQSVRGRSYLHFACHGVYGWRDVMQSGLDLAGGSKLTLARVISDLDLNMSRLAVLSACETGLTDTRQSPDEYIGLPAGFLQAGAPAIISTLWAVDDLSTRLLIERFYSCHLQDHLAPAVALRQAQIWLRDTTAGEMALAEQWRQVYQTTADQTIRKTAFRNTRYFARHPEVKPFASPYFWAPFTFTGA